MPISLWCGVLILILMVWMYALWKLCQHLAPALGSFGQSTPYHHWALGAFSLQNGRSLRLVIQSYSIIQSLFNLYIQPTKTNMIMEKQSVDNVSSIKNGVECPSGIDVSGVNVLSVAELGLYGNWMNWKSQNSFQNLFEASLKLQLKQVKRQPMHSQSFPCKFVDLPAAYQLNFAVVFVCTHSVTLVMSLVSTMRQEETQCMLCMFWACKWLWFSTGLAMVHLTAPWNLDGSNTRATQECWEDGWFCDGFVHSFAW